jgi:hypothetical protein
MILFLILNYSNNFLDQLNDKRYKACEKKLIMGNGITHLHYHRFFQETSDTDPNSDGCVEI